jgi:ATP-dependent Clp protease ATP-binding subunit ClpA
MMDLEHFDDAARVALLQVQDIVRGRGDEHVAPEHLLLAVLRDPDGVPRRALAAVGVASDDIDALLAGPTRSPRPGEGGASIRFTRLATKVVERAATGPGDRHRSTGDLLLAVLALRPNGATGMLTTTLGVDLERLTAAVEQHLPGER